MKKNSMVIVFNYNRLWPIYNKITISSNRDAHEYFLYIYDEVRITT